jgi:hypothetical protein
MDDHLKEKINYFYKDKDMLKTDEFKQKKNNFIKENHLAKIDIDSKDMKKFANMVGESIPYAIKFFKNPKKFYMMGDCKIYKGFFIDKEWGEMYILVKKLKQDKYFTMYFNVTTEKIPCDLADETQINERINKYDWLLIDKQIFSLWLNDQNDYLNKEYNSYLKLV